MSREIKFRAYQKNFKKMYSVKRIEFGEKGIDSVTIENVVNTISRYLTYYRHAILGQFMLDCLGIMQYTGLHDKNGKEIYEGDICIVSCKFFGMKNVKSKVVFKDGCFCFQYGCTDDYVKTYNAWESEDMEVIGNIYENPELLEGGE